MSVWIFGICRPAKTHLATVRQFQYVRFEQNRPRLWSAWRCSSRGMSDDSVQSGSHLRPLVFRRRWTIILDIYVIPTETHVWYCCISKVAFNSKTRALREFISRTHRNGVSTYLYEKRHPLSRTSLTNREQKRHNDLVT